MVNPLSLLIHDRHKIVVGMKIPWQVALGCVFIEGLIFIILTWTNFRQALIDAIPASIRYSIACGIGVQQMAERFPDKAVLPGLNTTFMGAHSAPTKWEERCAGCGNCVLDRTGGICPVARCSKSLFNGPCGGSKTGKCEIDSQVDCGWQLIYDRLKEIGQLEKLEIIMPVKDWSTSRDGGPRKRIREDLKI